MWDGGDLLVQPMLLRVRFAEPGLRTSNTELRTSNLELRTEPEHEPRSKNREA